MPDPNHTETRSDDVVSWGLLSGEGLPLEFQKFVTPWFEKMNHEVRMKNQTPDRQFAALNVEPGDRIRLRHRNKLIYGDKGPQADRDAAVLEGEVKAVKCKGGAWKVQIAGFDVAGNGIYWPVADYEVEVLHKVYRLTPEDRLVVELSGLSERLWRQKTDDSRAVVRKNYAKRVKKIREILAGEL